MAAVWLARLHGKHGFQKLFAVKFILPQYAADVRFQQMFLDEARIASGIAHPFVANILDLGEERGILYIVMDWIDGDSLSKLIASVARTKTRIPASIAVRIAADVAGALHAAHELHDADGRSLGVVHRDVSPSNILLTTKGSPKVIDFGIAKAVVRLTQETGAGLMKGKVMYMAPEQAMGKQVDRRADVWAVGAVLHTLLAGDPPFTGDNEMAMFAPADDGLDSQRVAVDRSAERARHPQGGDVLRPRGAHPHLRAVAGGAGRGADRERHAHQRHGRGGVLGAVPHRGGGPASRCGARGARLGVGALVDASADGERRGKQQQSHASLAHRSLVEDSGNAVSRCDRAPGA